MGNIILTGFMGTGKSTVGRRLARDLGLRFFDMDELIERQAGVPIKELFKTHGEERFRKMEGEVIERLKAGEFGDGLVVSTGGGAVVKSANREALRSWGMLICLSASVEEILKRVGEKEDRPLLATGEKRKSVEKLLKEREDAYKDCDLMVDTTGSTVEDVVERIKDSLKSR